MHSLDDGEVEAQYSSLTGLFGYPYPRPAPVAELGLSRATVDNRRQEGKLLALEFGSKRGFRFPQWQRDLVEERDVRASFEAVLNRLAQVGPWSRYRFFVQSSPELDGRTPVEALRAGEGAAVLHAAETWAQAEQGGG